MTSPLGRLGVHGMAANWRFVLLAVAAILLPVALAVITLTAPISELSISIANNREADPAYVELFLDNTDNRHWAFLLHSGDSEGLRLHLSPGTYEVSIDYVFNPSSENLTDGVMDYVSAAKVRFNGVHEVRLIVTKSGIQPNLAVAHAFRATPLQQLLMDPHFMLPVVTLLALHVLLGAAIWNYQRGLRTEKK